MIRAASWCSSESSGVVTFDGIGNQFCAAPLLSNDELTKMIGRTIKYLSRMTVECRQSLSATGLAMKSSGWLQNASKRMGLLAAGYQGCLLADENYFRDYLTGGRSLGRGNLFIYTLPTSTLGELAIALNLIGPSMHIDTVGNPLNGLSQHAHQLIADGEADAMLAIWSDAATSVCMAIDAASESGLTIPNFSEPAGVALHLKSLARKGLGESALVPSPGRREEG
jgi:3-oxoacyl-(acyl-carrier-protein) synthase